MIDPAFNGEVFNTAVADAPERKQEYAQGRYPFDAPNSETTVAVKVTDMLGGEVLGTAPHETRIAHLFGGYRRVALQSMLRLWRLRMEKADGRD